MQILILVTVGIYSSAALQSSHSLCDKIMLLFPAAITLIVYHNIRNAFPSLIMRLLEIKQNTRLTFIAMEKYRLNKEDKELSLERWRNDCDHEAKERDDIKLMEKEANRINPFTFVVISGLYICQWLYLLAVGSGCYFLVMWLKTVSL